MTTLRPSRSVLRATALVAATVGVVSLAPAAVAAPHERGAQEASRTAVPAKRGAFPSTEENSPVQTIPAPSSALAQMLGAPVTLRTGSAKKAGLLPAPIEQIPSDVEAGLQPQGAANHPLYPGAVSLVGHNGYIVENTAHGYSYLYSDSKPTLLPADERVKTQLDTIYDLASLSKLFTSIVAMQLADAGKLDLNAKVVKYVPAFGNHGKQDITVEQLLTHTSGMQPDPTPALWQLPADQRVNGILNTVPTAPAGSTYIYSDLNMLTLQLVEQAITGKRLDKLVAQGITKPLGMSSTMYNPPASLLPRIAATEYQTTPDRGLVHGVVHDENAWALDGVAGHAGVFSDARDLAVLAQTMLNGGTYDGHRILSKKAVIAMLTNLNQAFGGQNHGYGFELYQHWYMGALATPYTAGHTGFTGTTFVVDPTTRSFSILLTNAVHPSRSWGSTNPIRRAVTDDVAKAIPVKPAQGATSWWSGMVDASTATLTAPMTLRGKTTKLDFKLWYDTEPQSDILTLQTSRDGGTTWTTQPFSVTTAKQTYSTDGTVSGYDGHQWLDASTTLTGAAGDVLVRWQYKTDTLYHGRGVYVDAISARDVDGTIFDTKRAADYGHVAAVGFTASAT